MIQKSRSMAISPALGRLKQEDQEFEATERDPILIKKKKRKKKNLPNLIFTREYQQHISTG
jgi:hypothetical protein